MSLEAGHTLSHYEILEPIGRGGMGAVYRAKDSKLGRDVAIKVLPEEFAQDEERLRRFQREAKVLASLNHPNIAAIHGLEESEGTHYLVLELVEGETLAERIARGAIPVEEAIAIATKIAEALEEAHERGIVHRDLKPANVKLTPDDKVKVLDFGLAKAFAEEMPEADGSMSPTITRDATRVGVILGTAAYMSPEQAKGKHVDKRTDIFAFGAVLYEMLTGKKAFPGDDVSEVLAAVIQLEPDWDALPPAASPRLRELLQRCLAKDRAKRRRDIGDVRNELEDVVGVTAEPQGDARGWSPWAVVGSAVAIAALVGLFAWFVMAPEPLQLLRPVTHLSVSVPAEQGLRSGIACGPAVALSSDGRTLAYVGTHDGDSVLFVRRLNRAGAERLEGSEGACAPFFSPDGGRIGFFANGELKVISVGGGSAFTIAGVGVDPGGGAWSPDGTIWVSSGRGPLRRVRETGGVASPATKLNESAGEFRHSYPVLLEGGEELLFVTETSTGDFLALASVSAPEEHRHITTKRAPVIRGLAFVSTGHIVFHEGTGLFALPFEPDKEVSRPEPIRVLDAVPYAGQLHAHFSVARDGTLAYIEGAGGSMRPVWVDRSGTATPIAGAPPQHYVDPRLSPDGSSLALTVIDAGTLDVWVLDLRRENLTRMTFDPAADLRALWTPDGASLVFASNRTGTYHIYKVPADGGGEPEALTSGEPRTPTSISPDGKWVVFRQRRGGGKFDIGVAAIGGTSEPELLIATNRDEHTGMVSPDGRWLAYVSDESGREEVYVRSFPDMGGKLKVSINGGNEPMWSPTGNELFYRSDDKMMSVAFDPEGAREPGKPVVLFEARYARSFPRNPWTYYDVSADGDSFVMIQSEDGSNDRSEIQVLLGWGSELERLAPTE